MFAKLNIPIREAQKFIDSFDWTLEDILKLKSYYTSNQQHAQNVIKPALSKDKIWDGNGVSELNFPRQIGKRHIFISHSHGDIEIVKKLAFAIEQEFEVECFIDSMVWNNMNDLICFFDDNYSLNDAKTAYSYSKRNYSTAHVHTMLSMALLEMINDCECFLFVGSENSTLQLQRFKNDEKATLSPWIYAENTFVNLVKPIIPRWLYPELNLFSGGIGRIDEDRKLNIAYRLDLSTFHTFTADLLLNLCEEECTQSDFLYRLYEDSGALEQLKPFLD